MQGGAGFVAFAVAGLLGGLLAACSSTGQKADGGPSLDGSGGTKTDTGTDGVDVHLADAAADADADAADAAADAADAVAAHVPDAVAAIDAAASPIWTDGSTAIDVRCGGYHEGQMRFRATRDQMSSEQLALLAQVTTLPVSPADACSTDILICTIAVTGSAGSIASYVTYNFNQVCGSLNNLVDNTTFRPFAATLPCRFGREGTQIGGGGPPPFAPDERCFNGILGLGSVVPDPVLAVSEAGVTRHVEIDGCPSTSGAPLALDILTADGTMSVAQGMPVAVPGADQNCLTVDHAFAAPGNYRLHLSVPGVDGGDPGAWFFYRFF